MGSVARQGHWLGRCLLLSAAMAVVVCVGAVLMMGCGGDNGANTPGVVGGGSYESVTIGGQTWMKKNLNIATSSGSWCYNNDSSKCDTYGRLYDWRTALTVCPEGWRLPDTADWNSLVSAVGGSAGTKLKSKSGWNDYSGQSGNGTDSIGFSALPGGFSDYHQNGSFGNVGSFGHWWAATEHHGGYYVYYRQMCFDLQSVEELYGHKDTGFSVRCVKG